VEAPDASRRRPSVGRKTRRSWVLRAVANLWSKWKVEIAAIILLAVGIFLLVEKMQIRRTLIDGLQRALKGLSNLAGGTSDRLASFLSGATLSDLVGLAMVLVAIAFVIWRTRWRLTTMPRFTERKCPRCGGELHRIHRRWRDRVLNCFVPVRRYQCKNQDCRWRGLRVGRSRHE
jgi:hypothetical protein